MRIAPKDVSVTTLGSTAFLEEAIRPIANGTWIEVGVTPIDFELLGDPVQEVWLPRDEPTDLITFAVRPKAETTVPHVVRLRASIFHDNNVVQSFMLAALLEGAKGNVTAALARALNATPAAVRRLGDVGYLTRLEYASSAIGDAALQKERELTIIANDSAGDKLVTLKGEDLFIVIDDRTLPDKVRAAREALDRASRRGTTYRYTHGDLPNHGNPDELLDLLRDIAEAGFNIFNTVVRNPIDQQRVALLVSRGRGIHAAHVDASSVIPWSLVYDRAVSRTTKWYENPADPSAPIYQVASAICPVGLPTANGTMGNDVCGSANCLLDPAANEQRKRSGDAFYLEDTVICPRRFWGFATPIEVPAQQVKSVTGSVPQIKTTIKAEQPMTVVGGFNPNLAFAGPHANELKTSVFRTQATLVQPAAQGPEPFRQLLLHHEPDIVYFFCHALASLGTKGPCLDFGRGFDGVIDDVLEARQFAGRAWTHAPLVFINGCSTAGFSPYAPSEFIKQFIQGRGASAVIGTEVTVWEVLATEVARTFLQGFLDGKSAGEALLLARRSLLGMANPLGLVYTLYGSADLRLANPAAAAVG
jgi:hypothetical protein